MPLSDGDVREILRLIDDAEEDELRVETEAFSLYVRGERGRTPATETRARPRATSRSRSSCDSSG